VDLTKKQIINAYEVFNAIDTTVPLVSTSFEEAVSKDFFKKLGIDENE